MRLKLPKETPKQKKLIELIVIFNLVGMVGFCLPATRHIFMALVPWHLLLMGICLLVSHDRLEKRLLLFFALIYIIAYTAEWIGVHTQWLFGKIGRASCRERV